MANPRMGEFMREWHKNPENKERHRAIVHKRFVAQHQRNATFEADYRSGMTMQDIADKHGISRQRVEQIFRKLNIESRPAGFQSHKSKIAAE